MATTMISDNKLKETLTHPNTLTLARVVSIPLIVLLLLFPNRPCTFIAALIFSAASITDYLDGYYARTRGLVSNLGKMMDPLADKLMVSSALIMIVSHGWIPAWVVCVIVGREIAVTGLRVVMVDGGKDVSASNLGKYKTGFQIAAIIPLLIHFPYFGLNFHAIGMFFLWGALIFTLWSGMDYFANYGKLLKS